MSAKVRPPCPTCGKHVYYGIYCDNVCADVGYKKWKDKYEGVSPNGKQDRSVLDRQQEK